MDIKTKENEEIAVEPEAAVEEYQAVIPKQKRNYWEFGIFIAVVIILLAVVVVLGFLVFKTFSDPNRGKSSIQEIIKEENLGSASKEQEKKVEEVAKPVENDVQPTKDINPLETAIKILNGGAVGGSAGKAKEVLVAKGYKKVEAGNSDKSDYAGVTVFYQAEMKAVAEKVVADLKAKYPTAQVKLGVSAEEKSGPVVIILGK